MTAKRSPWSGPKSHCMATSCRFSVLFVSVLAVFGWLLNAFLIYKWNGGTVRFSESTTSNYSTTPAPSKPQETKNESEFRCSNYSLKDNKFYTRAAVAFFDESEWWWKFDLQLRAWYRSWIEMRKTQPAYLRTDLVLGTTVPNNTLFQELGCTTTWRNSKEEPSRCIVTYYLPYTRRNDSELGNIMRESRYYYADSIFLLDDISKELIHYGNFIRYIHLLRQKPFSSYCFTKKKDFLIRVDLDTFFSPRLANYIPPNNCSFISSIGSCKTNMLNLLRHQQSLFKKN